MPREPQVQEASCGSCQPGGQVLTSVPVQARQGRTRRRAGRAVWQPQPPDKIAQEVGFSGAATFARRWLQRREVLQQSWRLCPAEPGRALGWVRRPPPGQRHAGVAAVALGSAASGGAAVGALGCTKHASSSWWQVAARTCSSGHDPEGLSSLGRVTVRVMALPPRAMLSPTAPAPLAGGCYSKFTPQAMPQHAVGGAGRPPASSLRLGHCGRLSTTGLLCLQEGPGHH